MRLPSPRRSPLDRGPRAGFTLMEAVIATVIGALVLGAGVVILQATRRMSKAGDLSSALAEAAMAMEYIHRDLMQAVQKPDPAVDRVVFVSKEAVQFVRGIRGPEGALLGERVVYRRDTTGTNRFRLLRQSGVDAEAPLPGAYSAVKFSSFKGTGGPFVRVTLHVIASAVPQGTPATGSDEAVLTSLVRVAGPEMLSAPFFKWTFMDDLNSVELLEGKLGF